MSKVLFCVILVSLFLSDCSSPNHSKSQIVWDTLHGRILQIYLPSGYIAHSNYKTVYLLDGQNIFSDSTSFAGEWHVDETLDSLQSDHIIEPILAVAIYNSSQRAEEYSPYFDSLFVKYLGVTHWDRTVFFNHVSFLEEELFSYMEEKYGASSFPQDRAISGASLGGLHSLWWALNKSNHIGWASVHSPSLWVANHAILQEIINIKEGSKTANLWIDMGGKEWDNSFPRTVSLLSQLNNELYFLEDPEASHNEKAWGKRWGYFIQGFAGRQKMNTIARNPLQYTVSLRSKEGENTFQRIIFQNRSASGALFTSYADSISINSRIRKDSLGYLTDYNPLIDRLILYQTGKKYPINN